MGQFDLIGIPPAPRGVPQIDVTFDIDANGIVNVAALDKGTGKEQNIVIQSGGGLSEAEIETMIHEAESNAGADKDRKAVVEARNDADSLIYSTEKSVDDHGEKLSADDRGDIDGALETLKNTLLREDASADEIKAQISELSAASQKIGEAMYDGTNEKEESVHEDAPEDAEYKEK